MTHKPIVVVTRIIENATWDGYNNTETQIMIDSTYIKEISADEDKRLTEQERQEDAAMEYEMSREIE